MQAATVLCSFPSCRTLVPHPSASMVLVSREHGEEPLSTLRFPSITTQKNKVTSSHWWMYPPCCLSKLQCKTELQIEAGSWTVGGMTCAQLLSGLNRPQGHHSAHVPQHTTLCHPLVLMRGSRPGGGCRLCGIETSSSTEADSECDVIYLVGVILDYCKSYVQR